MKFVSAAGYDQSWLACDAFDAIGWFVANGGGLVPDATDGMLADGEAALGTWLHEQRLAFEFGKGGADGLEQWRSAAEAGLFAYDYDDTVGAYVLVARPSDPVGLDDLPPMLRAAAAANRLGIELLDCFERQRRRRSSTMTPTRRLIPAGARASRRHRRSLNRPQ